MIETVKAVIGGVEHLLALNESTGCWEATLTAPSLSSFHEEGRYYGISLYARDNAGNEATAGAQSEGIGEQLRLVVKEKVPPVVTIVSPGAGAYLTTASPIVAVRLRDDDSGVKLDSFTLKIDGGEAVTHTSPGVTVTEAEGGYDISYEVQEALSDGVHTVRAGARDNDGNQSTEASAEFTVDTVAPVLNVTSPAEGLVTNLTTGSVSGITSDEMSGPVALSILVNGADAGPVEVGEEGVFSKAVTYREGENTVLITATDRAGKTTSVSRTVTVNTTAPVFTSVELAPNPVDAGRTYVIQVRV